MTERDKQIIDLYLNNPELTTKEIGNMFNVSTGTIARIARINNLPRRKGNSGAKLTKQDIEDIKKKYNNCISKLALSQEYHISTSRIDNIVKDCAPISDAKRKNPTLNENYFEKIDSNEKAYWLGFLLSDGAITNQPDKHKYAVELTLKAEDEHILHMFARDLGVENKVYTSNKIYKRFSLGCKKMVQDLVKLGITQNKSFTVKVPIFDEQYNASFIRGIFDGDGGFTAYTRNNGQHCCELSFCGNKEVITWIQQTLLKELPGLNKNSVTDEHSIWRIRWGSKKDIKLLFDYLYKDANNHYLQRKYNLIQANTEVTN